MVHNSDNTAIKRNKEAQVFTRIPKEEKVEIQKLADALGYPLSYIVRDGLRREVAILRERIKELALQN